MCAQLQVDEFVSALINYEKENIPEVCLKAVQPYLDDPEFDPENIRRQSFAAAGLCAWVINIVKYYEVYCEVRIQQFASVIDVKRSNNNKNVKNLKM